MSSLLPTRNTKEIFKDFGKVVGDEKPKMATLAIIRAMCETGADTFIVDEAKNSLEKALIELAQKQNPPNEERYIGNPQMDYLVSQERQNLTEELADLAAKIFAKSVKRGYDRFIVGELKDYNRNPEYYKKTNPKLYQKILHTYESYESANYDQIFCYVVELLMRDVEAGKNPMGIKATTEAKEFLSSLRYSVHRRTRNIHENREHENLSNHETFFINDYLHKKTCKFGYTRDCIRKVFGEPALENCEYLSDVPLEVIRNQIKKYMGYGDFIRGCAQQLRNFIHTDATDAPYENVLLGRLKDVNWSEIAASFVREMNIQEIIVTGFELKNGPGKKIAFFMFPDEDPVRVVRERLGYYDLRGERDGDAIQLLDKQGEKVFTIEKVSPLKVNVYTVYDPNEYTEKTGVYREGAEQELLEYIKKSHTDYESMETDENGNWKMLDKENNVLRVFHCLSQTDETPAPSVSMSM